MTTRTSVILVAEEAAGAQVARLIGGDGRLELTAVVTTAGGPVARLAGALGVEGIAPSRLGAGWSPPAADLLLNVHSLRVLPDDLVDLPRLGAWNLHPGPLPERAGLNTVSWAILERADSYGVTLHRMTSTVDAGPVFARADFELTEEDTAIAVYGRCVRRGLSLVEDLLEHAAAGAPIPTSEQDLSKRRWFGAGVPDQVRIDWGRPAARIAAVIRACDYGPFPSPWGSATTKWQGRKLEVLTARVRDHAPESPLGTVLAIEGYVATVTTGSGTLALDRIRLDGRSARAGEVLTPGATLG